MYQAPRWKKYLIPHFGNCGPISGNRPEHKCGLLKALSMAHDPAALAIADLAKRFFWIFQIGNQDTEAAPL